MSDSGGIVELRAQDCLRLVSFSPQRNVALWTGQEQKRQTTVLKIVYRLRGHTAGFCIVPNG
jgi:hypothetical protein